MPSRGHTTTMQAAIVGAGNFGTAIANIVASNGVDVRLWMRDQRQLAEIRAEGENRRYLPGHALATRVEPTSDLGHALRGTDVAFVTVPSASFGEVTGELEGLASPGTCVISGTKGIGEGFRLMSQILEDALPEALIGVISGPNLAEGSGRRSVYRHRRGQPARGTARARARDSDEPDIPGLLQHGCVRCRTGRSIEEHLCHRLRHGNSAGSGTERIGHADHAQSRGDGPFRRLPRGQPVHLPRSCGSR